MNHNPHPNELATTWVLVAISPELGGQAFALGSNLRIGRSERNDIVIDSPKISRIHAKINKIGSKIFIQDQQSAHGTYVNGKRLGKDAVRIKTNDEVMFGDLLFIVQDDEHDRIIMPTQPVIDEQTVEIEVVEIEETQPTYSRPTDTITIEPAQPNADYANSIFSPTIDLSAFNPSEQPTVSNVLFSQKNKKHQEKNHYPSPLLYQGTMAGVIDDEMDMKKPPFFIMFSGAIFVVTIIILAIFSLKH